jgi:hypothetical protein
MFIWNILLYGGQYLKTGDFKMLIKSKGLRYVFLPHEGEAYGIRITERLILIPPEDLLGVFFYLPVREYRRHPGTGRQIIQETDSRRMTQTPPNQGICFGYDQVGGDQLLKIFKYFPVKFDCLTVMPVGSVSQGIPGTGIHQKGLPPSHGLPAPM